MENINDLIYAYSLGSLDNEEFQLVIEHLDSGEELNDQKLGEFQNLVSLLPLSLTIENPDPKLKDNVAKKLYRLKDEIKAQKQKNKPAPDAQETKGEREKGPSLIESEILASGYSEFKSAKEDGNNIQKNADINKGLPNITEIPPIQPDIPIKKNYNSMIWGFVLFFLLAIGIITIYLNISLKTNRLDNAVEQLKEEIGSLNTKLIDSQEIKEMLQSPDVQVINLSGTILSPNSFGKLIIGSDKEIGYIHFAHMPSIQENNLFQLWANISGSYIRLKTFQASDTMGFYSFKMSTLPREDNINFLLTEESSGESSAPSDKVYLQGILNP